MCPCFEWVLCTVYFLGHITISQYFLVKNQSVISWKHCPSTGLWRILVPQCPKSIDDPFYNTFDHLRSQAVSPSKLYLFSVSRLNFLPLASDSLECAWALGLSARHPCFLARSRFTLAGLPCLCWTSSVLAHSDLDLDMARSIRPVYHWHLHLQTSTQRVLFTSAALSTVNNTTVTKLL